MEKGREGMMGSKGKGRKGEERKGREEKGMEGKGREGREKKASSEIYDLCFCSCV